LTICSRVGNTVHLLDPATLQEVDVTSTVYWRDPFDALASVTDLVEFIVLDIEPSGIVRGKHVLADTQVAPSRAFMSTPSSTTPSSGKSKRRKPQASQHSAMGGMEVDIDGGSSYSLNYDYSATGASSQIYHTRTHLGGILQPGDTALGYFLTHSNFNSPAFESLDPSRVPDVILVKKSYPNRRKKSAGRARPWKLKSIAKEAEDNADAGIGRGALGRRGGVDQKKVEQDYEVFLRQIEEDEEMRAAINLYKNADVPVTVPVEQKKGKKQSQYRMEVDQNTAAEEDAEADFPEVRLDELLDDFEDMHIEGTGA
jgi:nonsense-mediated mRNA decay protein 3